jgi:hypothetical protein
MRNTQTLRKPAAALACALALGAAPADATLIASYQMDQPAPLVNSARATLYQPNMVDPGGAASPVHLADGGFGNSGAYQFDGVANYLTFGGAGYLFLADSFSNWTVSFWIKTTDNGVNLSYAGTPKVPVLGNTTGGVGFGLGIDGGVATYKRYSGGWQTAQGATNVADGVGHYITFVAVGSSNLSIYVDGRLDTANLSVPASGFSQLGVDIGRSYAATYGAFTLDDLRVWNEALSLGQIHDLIIPEPTSAVLLGLAGLLWLRRWATLNG